MRVVHFDRAEYERQWVVRHHNYEVQAYKIFNKALREQIAPVIAYASRYGIPTNKIIDLLVKKQPIEDAYKRVYVSVGVANAAWVFKSIKRIARQKSAVTFFNEQWNKLIQEFFTDQSADRVSDVTDTTRDKIKAALAEAQAQNLSISETASYLENKLDSPDFTRSRSLMIARTETTAAANYGASIAAESSDYETGKMWIAVLDANTRPDHVTADGQIVGQDELFVVGGSTCMFPGDLGLPANECIQCRCCLGVVPLSDERGFPVLKG